MRTFTLNGVLYKMNYIIVFAAQKISFKIFHGRVNFQTIFIASCLKNLEITLALLEDTYISDDVIFRTVVFYNEPLLKSLFILPHKRGTERREVIM